MTLQITERKSYPSFRKWRRIGYDGRVGKDPVMVPDRGFRKQLKTIDKDLEVVWDFGSNFWEIWHIRDDAEPYMFMRVQTSGRTYRELGADILLQVQKSFSLSPKQIFDYLEEAEKQDARRRTEDFKQKIRDFARDSFLNIHCKIIDVPRKYFREALMVRKQAEKEPKIIEVPKYQTIEKAVKNG